jgi:hypothetical protein
MAEDTRALEILRDDHLLGPFFDIDFDGAAYVRSLFRPSDETTASLDGSLEESPVERTLHLVRQRSSQLDVAIRDLVSRHQDALVSQASASSALKNHLLGIHERVDAAEDGLRRVVTDVVQPLVQMKDDALALRNATLSLEVIRRLQRAHQIIRKLRALASQVAASSSVEIGGSQPGVLLDPRTMARVAPLLREAALVSIRPLYVVKGICSTFARCNDVCQAYADESISGMSILSQDRSRVAAIADAVRVRAWFAFYLDYVLSLMAFLTFADFCSSFASSCG